MNSLEWNDGMERWSGLLEWSTGLEYWSATPTNGQFHYRHLQAGRLLDVRTILPASLAHMLP